MNKKIKERKSTTNAGEGVGKKESLFIIECVLV
jgi:hypothetical protein